jgi:hypothetical protein
MIRKGPVQLSAKAFNSVLDPQLIKARAPLIPSSSRTTQALPEQTNAENDEVIMFASNSSSGAHFVDPMIPGPWFPSLFCHFRSRARHASENASPSHQASSEVHSRGQAAHHSPTPFGPHLTTCQDSMAEGCAVGGEGEDVGCVNVRNCATLI